MLFLKVKPGHIQQIFPEYLPSLWSDFLPGLGDWVENKEDPPGAYSDDEAGQ